MSHKHYKKPRKNAQFCRKVLWNSFIFLKKIKIAIYVISILRLQIRKNARNFSEYFNIVFKTAQFP